MLNKNHKFTLEDLKLYDPHIYSSLEMISSNNLTQEDIEALDINFNVEIYDDNGKMI